MRMVLNVMEGKANERKLNFNRFGKFWKLWYNKAHVNTSDLKERHSNWFVWSLFASNQTW